MITVQTNYSELVSKTSSEIKSELAEEKVQLKNVRIHTARGGQ